VVTTYNFCRSCRLLLDETGLDRKFHQKDSNDYPPDMKEEFFKLSDWIQDLTRLYKHRLSIRIIDVQSLVGVYKSLRHRVRFYPTFIIEGRETYAGWDKDHLEEIIDKHIRNALSLRRRRLQPILPQENL
jgi:hypothetical protein